MSPLSRCASVLVVALSLGLAARPLEAQSDRVYRQVISANPFGLLLDVFNAEYERKVSETATAGLGGSFLHGDDPELDNYLNADVFYRYYPSGKPLDGWAFGMKAGITRVSDVGTFPGFGFDTNWSWLLGKNENFYVGLGFGLKRLFGGDPDDFDWEYLPTLRIVNVGFAF